jgi:hypothetical protein
VLKKFLLRFAIRLRLQARGSPSVANPLSGTKVHRTFVLVRFAHGLFQLAGVAQGCAAYGAEDAKQKARFLALLHFSNTSVFEKCAVPLGNCSCVALPSDI